MPAKIIWSADRFGKPKRRDLRNPNISIQKLDEAVAKSQRMLEYINTISVNRNEVLRLVDVLRDKHNIHSLVDTILDADQSNWRPHAEFYFAVIKLLEEKISPNDSPA